MNISDKDEITRLLKELVKLLALSEYETINNNNQNGQYSVQELQELIEEYGGKVTYPIVEDFDQVNIIEILNKSEEFYIEYELWINNEKSDLTLSCLVIISNNSSNIVIEDIHVL